MNLEDKISSFQPTTKSFVLRYLEDIYPSKSAGIDNLAGKFLKEGVPVFLKSSYPVFLWCNDIHWPKSKIWFLRG